VLVHLRHAIRTELNYQHIQHTQPRHPSTGNLHHFFHTTIYTDYIHASLISHLPYPQILYIPQASQVSEPRTQHIDTGAQSDDPESTSTNSPRSFYRLNWNLPYILMLRDWYFYTLSYAVIYIYYILYILYTINYSFNSVCYVFVSPNLLHHLLPSYSFVQPPRLFSYLMC
jgi:hypothetical protein